MLGDQAQSGLFTDNTLRKVHLHSLTRGGVRISFPDDGDIFRGPHPDSC